MDEHDMLGTECDISNSPPPPDNPIHSSISPPKSRKRAQRNPGEKVVLRLDDYNRPVSPKDDVVDLSRHAGKLARREIPLIYNDFRDVPPEPYERVIKGLNEHYVFENFEENGVDCEYIRDKVKDAWKGFKSKLKRKRVDGKDPAVVKLENAPKGHPIEDWRMFIDNCNTEEMQKRSAQNSDNRAGCKFPNCSGRIPAQVVRHKIAKEKGVLDSQVGLGRVYREMHTKKKDKALQNPEDDDGGDYNIEDDGDFSPGRLNAIGAGVSKTLVKKMIPIVKRHENEEVNSKMWKNKMEGKIDGLATVVSKFIKSVDANRSQSPSVQLSGNPYDGSATSMYTQKPSMRPPGKDHVVGVSPLNNTRRTSLPPSVNRGDVDVSLTMPISPSGYPDGDSSQKLTTQRTSMPSSGHSHDVNASMRKPMPLSGHHLGGDSFTPNKRKFVSSGGHCSDGLSQVNKAKTTSMSPSGHSYNRGSSVTKSVPLSGYSRNEDSSPKNNTGKTTMPSSEHRYDGSSLVNSTKKIGIPPTVDHYQTSTFAKTPKTSMLLSGHCHDGGSSSGKNSIQMPPIVSKEHHHEVNASLVNNSKRAVMFPSGKDLDDMIISKGLPKISTGDARDLIGTKVKVRGGWPSKVLALGAIKAVHPLEEFEGRKLGFGNFLISVDSVMCPAFQLPYPQGGKTTLGQVEGGLVIWPRDDIKLMGIS